MSETARKLFTIKRSRVRFRPDPLDLAFIDSRPGEHGGFQPDTVAVIVDEHPRGGCGLVIVENGRLARGNMCRVQVGRLAPLLAQIVWRRTIDDGVVRIGLRYLE